MKRRKLRFVDCTLRDGEQAPGVFFTLEEKVAIADLLDQAGIDVLDAGMPSVSAQERKILETLVDRGYRATIAGTVRANQEDIDLAVDCGLKEVFLFMPVSPQHLKHKFGIGIREVRPRIERAIEHAAGRGLRVNFVAEDSVRADPEDLAPLFDRIGELGAQSVILCDTVGVMMPNTMEANVRRLTSLMKNEMSLGVHCHNDYGLGTANTLAAIHAGCNVVTATVNGLGERAGNAPLEEIVCALADLERTDLGIRRPVLLALCQMVAQASGVFLMPTKPIAGLNAFRHESGVHVDGMLKDPSTYESIRPETLGLRHQLILGKHSGRGLVEAKLSSRGIRAEEGVVLKILERVKSAKESRDKKPYAEMADRLSRFWSEYLSFPEEKFWEIVDREISEASAYALKENRL